MAVFVKHTACTRCTSSDALAHYSDGSTYCFSCGSGSGLSAASFSATEAFQEEDDEEVPLLPSDLSHDFPKEVLQWVEPTGLTYAELIRHGYFFSRAERGLLRVLQQTLIGAVCQSDGEPLHLRRNPYELRKLFRSNAAEQGPAPKGPKTLFRGNKEEAYGGVQSLDTGRAGQVCIVEDSPSAIKVGRSVDCYPLFGSSISNSKLCTLVAPYKKVWVWLDSDKLHSARAIAERCIMLGKEASVVFTQHDPKYLNADKELK